MPKLNRISIKDNNKRTLPEGWRVRYEHWQTNRLTSKNQTYQAHHTRANLYKPVESNAEHPLYELVGAATAVTSPKDLYLRKVGNHIALQRALKEVF